MLSLTAGSYSDFSVTVNGCTGTFCRPVNLSDPATPTLSAGTSTNPSTCVVQTVRFNLAQLICQMGSYTKLQKRDICAKYHNYC
ncbi:MAG: hypothetical protein IPN46_16405 [Saprospiraceae bacterium]|nr:hypothetical protein [Saprospiraceae bacterium]